MDREKNKNMKTTLVIMTAGIGSRFGGGIKQLAPVGLNGEIIMDYSIHDAIEAGFNKIVFIIRKDIKDACSAKKSISTKRDEIISVQKMVSSNIINKRKGYVIGIRY